MSCRGEFFNTITHIAKAQDYICMHAPYFLQSTACTEAAIAYPTGAGVGMRVGDGLFTSATVGSLFKMAHLGSQPD